MSDECQIRLATSDTPLLVYTVCQRKTHSESFLPRQQHLLNKRIHKVAPNPTWSATFSNQQTEAAGPEGGGMSTPRSEHEHNCTPTDLHTEAGTGEDLTTSYGC